MQNKPNLPPPGRDRQDLSRETKPFAPRKMSGGDARPTKSGGPVVRNKPNFGRGGLREPPLFQYSIIPPFQSPADCAKQSQFRRAGWARPEGKGRGVLYKQTQFAKSF